MTKAEIRRRILEIMEKLEQCRDTRETTADEMVREYWGIVGDFPIPLREVT